MTKYKINENTDKDMAKRLLEERLKLESNRKEFVKIHNISYSNLDNWESGRRDFPVYLLNQLDELGADIYYIVTGKRQLTSNSDQSQLLEAKDEIIAGLKRENELLRKQLEGTSENSELVKIAEKLDALLNERGSDQAIDEEVG